MKCTYLYIIHFSVKCSIISILYTWRLVIFLLNSSSCQRLVVLQCNSISFLLLQWPTLWRMAPPWLVTHTSCWPRTTTSCQMCATDNFWSLSTRKQKERHGMLRSTTRSEIVCRWGLHSWIPYNAYLHVKVQIQTTAIVKSLENFNLP